MTRRLGSLILALLILSGLFLGFWQLRPPKAREGPDFVRLEKHIKGMASEPHPAGSQGIALTQGYLKEQLTEMGYRFQEEACPLDDDALMLRNIFVYVDAPGTDETVLFMAHTDSVPGSPGAFDDIVSVAALLEGLYDLKGQTPNRDLVFLFTDGEELGLLGAKHYLKDHPEMQKRTRLVVNLEARGNRGALMLFETSRNNLELVRLYQKAVLHPYATSVAAAIYHSMPNSTDLSPFLEAGYPGINLGVVEGGEVYHSPQDNPDTYSRDSAWHYLETARGLIHTLAFSPHLDLHAEENAVFFPFFPGKILVISQGTANLLSHAAFLVFFVVTAGLLAARKARLKEVMTAFVMQLLGLALAAGGALVLSLALARVLKAGSLSAYWQFRGDALWFTGLLVVSALLYARLSRPVWLRTPSPLSHALGSLLLPAILALLSAHFFPAGSYLFSLPVLAGLLSLLLTLAYKPGAALYAGLASALALMLSLPVIHLLFTGLGMHKLMLPAALSMQIITLVSGQAFLIKD